HGVIGVIDVCRASGHAPPCAPFCPRCRPGSSAGGGVFAALLGGQWENLACPCSPHGQREGRRSVGFSPSEEDLGGPIGNKEVNCSAGAAGGPDHTAGEPRTRAPRPTYCVKREITG